MTRCSAAAPLCFAMWGSRAAFRTVSDPPRSRRRRPVRRPTPRAAARPGAAPRAASRLAAPRTAGQTVAGPCARCVCVVSLSSPPRRVPSADRNGTYVRAEAWRGGATWGRSPPAGGTTPSCLSSCPRIAPGGVRAIRRSRAVLRCCLAHVTLWGGGRPLTAALTAMLPALQHRC